MGFWIDMIDVGEGDSFLLTLDSVWGEKKILIDAGRTETGPDVRRFVESYAGGCLDAAIVTHLDMDHVGGMKDVVEHCAVGAFFMNLPADARHAAHALTFQRLVKAQKKATYWELLEKSLDTAVDLVGVLAKQGLEVRPIKVGTFCNLGDIVLNVLSPNDDRLTAAWEEIEADETPDQATLAELYKTLGIEQAPATSAENNSSVVLELEYKGQPYALFAGDAGAGVLTEVTAGKSYPFLKVPHHGSKTGLDEGLVAQLRPRTAYIPVGENKHGHPCIEILDLLHKYGAQTFCSQKTVDCRRSCPLGGFGNICYRHEKDFRQGWSTIDPLKCINNRVDVLA